VVLPAEKFTDFKVVDKENEEEFEYVISSIIVQFLEKFQDTALEFPSIIDGSGRALIHSICNFLGMASHSISSGKNRRIIIYPKHLFLDK
jgi:R3H domain